ncbi:hypothetical protein C5D07_13985 [Rathayibacter tritici]|uniref:DUF6338 family protein n=1 Tax=Rathayibacter tritici TaxID=33888 RepID=UPI000CE83A7D|nr:DUF6338 family protein [Rathayibacter tritici]PPF29182.1 hypothetical protein C5C06_07025 [Rathayibacter tritici]PPI11540.1 hypothetical protein C5D07_13985 [Rathayibacter tritici]
MIPTTVTGILLLIVLLLPGFLFITFREQHRPTRRLSTFRETSVVLAATTVSYIVPLVVVIAVAVVVPGAREELARALVSPLWIQPPDASEVRHLEAESIVISARHLRYLSARYFAITGGAPPTDRDHPDPGRRGRGTRIVLAIISLGVLAFRRHRRR